MKYALSDLPALLRTPLGRRQLRDGLRYRTFPIVAARARRYRRTALGDVHLVAVVGSFGKTTTTRFTRAALDLEQYVDLRGNTFWRLARKVLDSDPAQPQRVFEVGIAKPGEMARYAGILSPDITVVSSIGSEHREYLSDPQTTRHEKAFMVRALPTDGVAVLNGDDDNVMWMSSQTEARIVTFGLEAQNEVRATEIETDWPRGTRFRLHIGDDSWPARVRLFGRPMIYSALAGVAVAHVAGREIHDVLANIADLTPTTQRLCPVPLDNGAWLLDDTYKSPAETMATALDTLRDCQADHKYVVLGLVPDYTENPAEWYAMLARQLTEVADRTLLLAGAHEPFVKAAVHQGLDPGSFVDGGHDILGAADRLRDWLRPQDIALLKGYKLHTDRITLRLTGSKVGCDLPRCDVVPTCRICPMCERGWEGSRPVM